MIRCCYSDDDGGFLASGTPFDDDVNSWWAGVQKCAATVALAAVVATTAISTAQAAQVFDYHQDDPAGKLFGQPDEDFWINPVAPAPATLYQQLPYGSLRDPEEIPAGNLVPPRGQDEDFWQNPVAPVPFTLVWPNQNLFEQHDPAGALLSGKPDEDFWANPVAPIRSYPIPPVVFADESVVPAIAFQPDEDFYAPPALLYNSGLWQLIMLLDDGSSVPAFQPDEDFWTNPVAPVPAKSPYFSPWLDAGEPASAPPPFQPDEDYWASPVAPVGGTPALPQPFAFDSADALTPVPFQADEDFWENAPTPASAINFWPQPFAFDSQEAGKLFGQQDEDFWQNPVFPVSATLYQQLPYSFDIGEIVPIAPGPFVLIAALQHKTYSQLIASGGMTIVGDLL